MTTTVTVTAHCNDTTEVRVTIVNSAAVALARNIEEEFVLQDGQTAERVVYGDREIRVCEQAKEQAP